MPKIKIDNSQQTVELLQKILIVLLSKEGIPQNEIARIVGIHVTKVSSILKNKKTE